MKIFKTLLLAVCCMFSIVLMGCENVNTPSLSTPQNLIVKNGIISFKQVDDADFYSISINDKVFSVDAKYNSNVTIVDNVVNYDANKLFAYGNTYSIKVKARGDEKYDSHYTAVYEYLHNVDLIAPQNVRLSAGILVWDNVNDATYYMVKAFYKTGNTTNQYRCDINSCETSGILAQGTGEYQFSVKAVREGNNAAESVFSDVVNYSNYQQLSTPTIKNITETANGLVMTASIDENANKITINCGTNYRNIFLNGADGNVSKSGSNYVINLTKVFGIDEFKDLKTYVFTLQSKIETQSQTYFTNSAISEQFIFNKTQQLSTPTLSVELDGKSEKFIASWNEIENAIGYEILLNGTLIYVENTKTNFIIEDNNFIIEVCAVGAGNYLTSAYSNSITK